MRHIDNAFFDVGGLESESGIEAIVGVLQVDLIQPRQGRLEKFDMIEALAFVSVEIAVRDIGAIADLGGAICIGFVVGGQLFAHQFHFTRQCRRLSQAGHRLNRQPLNPLILGVMHQLLHVLGIATQPLFLQPHQITRHSTRVGADRLSADQGANLDEALIVATGHRDPFRIFAEETTEFTVCGKQAINGDTEIVRLLLQANEILIRQLIELEE